MNTSFERSAAATDEWYTPKEIIDSLGRFDLDPCAPINPLWQTAKIMYNKSDDGYLRSGGVVFGLILLIPVLLSGNLFAS